MKFLITLCIMIFCSTVSFYAEVLYYQGSYDTNILDKWLYIEKGSDKTIVTTTNLYGGASEFTLDNALTLRRWNYQDTKNKTDLKASYTDNTILIDGMIKGKKVHKEISTGGLPWYQDWGYSLSLFALSTNNKLTFWTVSPENLDYTSKFKAVKVSNETITFHGAKIEALRVKFSIEGIFEAFFNADYWFRVSDGRQLRGRIPFPFGGKTYTEDLIDSKMN